MTGFAVESSDLSAGTVTLELRAVNSRFLELNFRMGEEFRVLEPTLRERITERVRRGKVECRIGFAAAESGCLPEHPNTALLNQLAVLSENIRQAMPDARPMSVAEALRWPGMLGDNTPDATELHSVAMALLDKALVDFNASRSREGVKLGTIVLERVAAMREQSGILRPKVPAIVAAYRDKLTQRMEELLQTADHDRIHQEVAFFAQKIDVDEELDRLLTHLDEIKRVLKIGGPVGKRLDFLMQELNREANTLGSKSVSLDFSHTSVEFKVLIDQMREQVQNLE